MDKVLHITSGDSAGGRLAKAGLPGEVFVWHDILYDGPRSPGWPDEDTLNARAAFLESAAAGGLKRSLVLKTLRDQYRKLAEAAPDRRRSMLSRTVTRHWWTSSGQPADCPMGERSVAERLQDQSIAEPGAARFGVPPQTLRVSPLTIDSWDCMLHDYVMIDDGYGGKYSFNIAMISRMEMSIVRGCPDPV